MRRLSCKIFNEFYFPELTPAHMDYGPHEKKNFEIFATTASQYFTVERNSSRPFDLDPSKNFKYYAAHPQIRELTHQLREYGLFRDEHRDFNEAMKKSKIARGKVFRERRGPISKKKK